MARAIDADAIVEEFWKPEYRTQTRRDFIAAIQKWPTLTQPNEWISVGDRLPGQWNNVIAFYDSGVIRQSWVNGNNEWLFADIYGVVTHWMPLPNPPADQKTGDEQ